MNRAAPIENHTVSSEDSAPQTLEILVKRAERSGASDIHLHMTGSGAEIAFRLDGLMTPAGMIPKGMAERVFGRIKFLARLKTYQDSLPQDGRIAMDELGLSHDVRVATYPTVTGEKIVLRLFHESTARSLQELQLPASARDQLKRILNQTSGLMLLTGPTGSGKTTTIYSCLIELAAIGGRHIITIEDPAEQILPGIMQTEVNEARGLTFARATRHLLRQDPQVIVIGEIRDEETANIAVRAALTGHLVISTLHAGSCRGVYERLQLMCDDQSSLVAAVELIANQRLMRRLCATCAGTGCETCLETGYRGRVPLMEWFRMTDAARADLRRKGAEVIVPEENLLHQAREVVQSGLSNREEIERIFGQ